MTKAKYRPFRSAKECWNEMLKHYPFGWVKVSDTSRDVYEVIQRLSPEGVGWMIYDVVDKYGKEAEGELPIADRLGVEDIPLDFDTLFVSVTFADGTPFGVIDEA